MRIAIAFVGGLVAGFLLGIMLSQLIGIVGFLVFGQVVGVKYLALYTAAAGAIIAPLVISRRRRRVR